MDSPSKLVTITNQIHMQWKNKIDKKTTLQYRICMQVDDAFFQKSASTMRIDAILPKGAHIKSNSPKSQTL